MASSVQNWATTVLVSSISLALIAVIGLVYCIYDIFIDGLEMPTVIELAMYTAVAVTSFVGVVASQNRNVRATRQFYFTMLVLNVFFVGGYVLAQYLNYQNPDYVTRLQEKVMLEDEQITLEQFKLGTMICAGVILLICCCCTLCGYKLASYS
jgi:hypothetical protein